MTTTMCMRRLSAIVLLCLLNAVPAVAQEHSPDMLGRLFFSPQARAALERQRQLNTGGHNAVQGEILTVDGVVRRSAGAGTIWINGMALHDGGNAGVVARHSKDDPSRTTLRVADDAQVSLRVGESIDRSTGERRDSLGGGRISVNRSAVGSRPSRP